MKCKNKLDPNLIFGKSKIKLSNTLYYITINLINFIKNYFDVNFIKGSNINQNIANYIYDDNINSIDDLYELLGDKFLSTNRFTALNQGEILYYFQGTNISNGYYLNDKVSITYILNIMKEEQIKNFDLTVKYLEEKNIISDKLKKTSYTISKFGESVGMGNEGDIFDPQNFNNKQLLLNLPFKKKIYTSNQILWYCLGFLFYDSTYYVSNYLYEDYVYTKNNSKVDINILFFENISSTTNFSQFFNNLIFNNIIKSDMRLSTKYFEWNYENVNISDKELIKINNVVSDAFDKISEMFSENPFGTVNLEVNISIEKINKTSESTIAEATEVVNDITKTISYGLMWIYADIFNEYDYECQLTIVFHEILHILGIGSAKFLSYTKNIIVLDDLNDLTTTKFFVKKGYALEEYRKLIKDFDVNMIPLDEDGYHLNEYDLTIPYDKKYPGFKHEIISTYKNEDDQRGLVLNQLISKVTLGLLKDLGFKIKDSYFEKANFSFNPFEEIKKSNIEVDLKKGWNMVSFPVKVNTKIEKILVDDILEIKDQKYSYNSKAKMFTTLNEIVPYSAYFVKCKEDIKLIFD